MALSGRTYERDHHATGVRVPLPVQRGAGQGFNSVARIVVALVQTGPAFGLGLLSRFVSRRDIQAAIEARGVSRPLIALPASLADLFDHIADIGGQTRAHLSRLPVWRASRCLPVQKLIKRQAKLMLPGVIASLGHSSVLSCSRSSSASTKARKAFHDVGKVSHGSGQISQEQSHV